MQNDDISDQPDNHIEVHRADIVRAHHIRSEQFNQPDSDAANDLALRLAKAERQIEGSESDSGDKS